jgi:septation ring formation regulator EzrA
MNDQIDLVKSQDDNKQLVILDQKLNELDGKLAAVANTASDCQVRYLKVQERLALLTRFISEIQTDLMNLAERVDALEC